MVYLRDVVAFICLESSGFMRKRVGGVRHLHKPVKPLCNKYEWAEQEGQEDRNCLEIHPPSQQKTIKITARDEMPRCGAGDWHFPPMAVATNYPKLGGFRQ